MKYVLSSFILLFAFIDSFSQQGQTLNFSSAGNTAVSLANDISLSGTFTIETWVFPVVKADFSTIIGNKAPGISSAGYFLAINSYGTTNGKVVFETQNTSAQSITSVTWDEWQHLAVTYNGNALKMYINGIALILADSMAVNLQNSPTPCYLGDIPAYIGNANYNGSLDELRVWNYARTESEIQSNMNCQLSQAQPGLVAYYRFNQGVAGGSNGAVNILTDLSGDNNNGTLQNFALSGTASNWIAPGGVSNITAVQTVNSCAGNAVTIGSNIYVSDGIYLDTLTAANGCDSLQTTTITFLPEISSSQNADLCDGDSIMVGTSTHSTEGIFFDILPANNGCDSLVTTTITLNSINTAVSQAGNILSADAFANGYQWVNCDNLGPINGETNQTFTASVDGSYAVMITVGNCTSISSCFTVLSTGIHNQYGPSVTIRPNPAIDFLLIQDLPGNVEYNIVNLTGFKIKQGNLIHSEEKVDISELKSGIYFLYVNGFKAKRFVKN